jgi:hypothetical protein
MYPSDRKRLKALVLTIWFLDTCHTICIWLSLWSYFIDNYGNLSDINNIPWALALSILFPAILTFFVHNFFALRIFMLSKRNYYLTIPIVVLAVLRVVSATVTTAFMLHLHTFTRFRADVRFIFTTGLALSTAVDVIITGSLYALLQSSRSGMATLDAVIDALIRYTFETSTLTCAGTIASMLCWAIIPNNLIFMGLHFVIGKLYANSLLVALNTRESIRRAHSQDKGLRVDMLKEPRKPHKSHDSGEITLRSSHVSQVDNKLNEGVEVVVERDVEKP